jgi:FkbM family methyltransferase
LRTKPAAPIVLVVGVLALGSGYAAVNLGRRMALNGACCQVPFSRNLMLSLREILRIETFPSEIGQDKWVLETVFPGVRNGFFLDVGSGDGTIGSNTKALEEHGWTGVCVDPFPKNMRLRTCRILTEVVYSESGKRVAFSAADGLGGIVADLGAWKEEATKHRTVEFTTVTMADILRQTKAPPFVHFINLDIEGAELDALRGFPFDTYRFGAMAVEHNYEEPKRSDIDALLKSHGYRRVHSFRQDDFFVSEARVPDKALP